MHVSKQRRHASQSIILDVVSDCNARSIDLVMAVPECVLCCQRNATTITAVSPLPQPPLDDGHDQADDSNMITDQAP
jgi:hypothetical protein